MTRETIRMPILVATNIIAHYRESLYSKFNDSDQFHYEFASDPSPIDGIRTADLRRFHRVHYLRNLRVGRANWQSGLLAIALRGNYAAVVLTGDASFLSTWIVAIILRLRGVKVVFWTMGWRIPDRGLRRLIRLAFYQLADMLLLYGDNARTVGKKLGYPEEKMTVIYNSVDSSNNILLKDNDRTYRELQPHWQVGVVSRIREEKRFDLLLQASKILKDSGQPIRIAIVGDGPESNNLIDLARDLGVELDILPASFDDATLSDFHSRIGVTVIPTAGGLAVTQSLRYGVPVITDNDDSVAGPECEAIREGITGSRCINNDASDLADNINQWVRRIASDEGAIARACKDEVLARWTSDSQIERIEKVLNRILKRGPGVGER